MSNYVVIENHTDKSNTSRSYSKISVYFVTAIMKYLVRQAISNATGSHVQKLGGHAPPCSKVGGAAAPPPAPASLMPATV